MMISYQTLGIATGGLNKDLLSPVMHCKTSNKGGRYVLLYHSDILFLTSIIY